MKLFQKWRSRSRAPDKEQRDKKAQGGQKRAIHCCILGF